MDEVYQIRIQQTNNSELVLPYPSTIDHLVNNLLQPQYRIGQDFVDGFEKAKQPILDAISDYFAPQQNFRCSIENNKLFLKIPAITDRHGQEKYQYTNEEYNAMTMLACFVANYSHVKALTDLNDGPVNVKGTYDNKADPSYFTIGAQAIYELMIALSSPEKQLSADEDPSAQKVVWSNFIKAEPMLIHIN